MPVNDTDKLLVNNGSKTETITFAQFKDGTVLNDSDKFLINDGTKTETVTWAEIEDELGPKGVVNQPIVLKPKDGAGSGDLTYLKTDKITKIEGGGVKTCETELIESVTETVVSYSNATTGFFQPARAFNGSISNAASVENSGDTNDIANAGVLNFNPTLSGELILRIRQSAFNKYRVIHAGGETDWTPPYNSVVTENIGDETVGTFNGISQVLCFKTNASYPSEIYTVSIGGNLLIDGTNTITTLTFPSAQGFDCFPVGTVVQRQGLPNLGAQEFYDLDVNDANNWNENRVPANLWDGRSDTYCSPAAGKSFTGDFSSFGGIPISGNLYIPEGGIMQDDDLKVNGISIKANYPPVSVTGPDSNTRSAHVIPAADLNGKINNIYFNRTDGSNGAQTSAWWDDGGYIIGSNDLVEVKIISKDEDANTITVDGGDWLTDAEVVGQNRDQVWSNMLYSGTTTYDPAASDQNFQPSNPATYAFDGNLQNTAYENGSSNWIYFRPSSPITVTSKVEFYARNTVEIKVNGDDKTYTGGDSSWNFSKRSVDSFTGQLTEFAIRDLDNTGSSGLAALYIDDVLLVDTGAGGYTKLVKETPYDNTLTVAGDTDLADMTGAVFMTDGSTEASGAYTQTPYKLVTTDIESVSTISWTETGDWNPSGPVTYMFDGDITTFTFANTNSSAAVDFQNVVATKSLRVYGYAGGLIGDDPSAGEGQWFIKANNTELMISGGSYLPEGTSSAKDWVDLSSDFTFPLVLNQVRTAGSQGGVSAIEIDGSLLTQSTTNLAFPGDVSTNPDLKFFRPGDVVQSNLYSPGFVETAFEHSERAFNGDATTIASNAAIARNDYIKWKSAKLLSGNISVYTRANTSINQDVTVKLLAADNSTVIAQQTVSANADAIVEVAFAGVSDVKYIYVNDDTGTSTKISYIYSIKVNGSLLIDEVKVISTGYPDSNTMVVDGGSWNNSNQSQVWSDGFPTSPVTATPEAAFDGDLTGSDTAYNETRGNLVWTPHSSITSGVTKLEVLLLPLGGGNDAFTVNTPGAVGGPLAVTNGNQWFEIPLAGSTFGDITITPGAGGYATLKGVKVNGKLLVDAVNDSQVWSNGASGGINRPGYEPDKAFDGDLTTFFNPEDSQSATFSFTGLTIQNSLRLYCRGDNGNLAVTLGGVQQQITTDTGAAQWRSATVSGPVAFTSIDFASSSPALYAVEVDGKILVDTGVPVSGDTHVEYQTNGGQGTIVEVNTDDNTLLISNTGDRDNRWIAENKAGTDFYVAGPSIVDEPLLTTNVELESTQFATTPDGVDGLKEIIWNINGVDQSAGTLNPYRPTGLPLNSEVTIKVKHVANSIGESAWSASTKFTTGASRSLKDHYVKQIRELEKQLAAAQGTKTRSVETGERKRARNADGTYRGDDPSTPDVNEAWEDG